MRHNHEKDNETSIRVLSEEEQRQREQTRPSSIRLYDLDERLEEIKDHFENPKDGHFICMRTFRKTKSSENPSIVNELDYLEGRPSYIFTNPSTIVGKNLKSKTISLLQGNDWSGQPSLIFNINPSRGITIGHFGFGSLNSFSSTDAISIIVNSEELKERFNISENTPLKSKIEHLKTFLAQHWDKSVKQVARRYIPEQTFQRMALSRSESKKTFKKDALSAEISLKHQDHNKIIGDINNFFRIIEEASSLEKDLEEVPHRSRHPHASVFAQNQRDVLNRYLSQTSPAIIPPSPALNLQQELQAHDFLKTQRVLQSIRLKESEKIIEECSAQLHNGLRHNELISRLYPWDVCAIEWGNHDEAHVNAITSYLITQERRAELSQEFSDQGMDHPLFKDFLLNMLSMSEQNGLDWETLVSLRDHMIADAQTQKDHPLSEIFETIKHEMNHPLQLLHYNPVHGVLAPVSHNPRYTWVQASQYNYRPAYTPFSIEYAFSADHQTIRCFITNEDDEHSYILEYPLSEQEQAFLHNHSQNELPNDLKEAILNLALNHGHITFENADALSQEAFDAIVSRGKDEYDRYIEQSQHTTKCSP